jgi:hypothetical protein
VEVKLEDNSWLNMTDLFEYEGIPFWGQTEYPDIPFSEDDLYLEINQEQAKRIDLIAFDNYGDPNLFWVILLANDLDLPNQLREGMVLRLPSLETVNKILTPK